MDINHNALDNDIYETEQLLEQYLLFHYGSEEDFTAFPFLPRELLNFPVQCATKCLDPLTLPKRSTAADIGCGVGRSSFELARFCQKVVGVDLSHSFIEAAQEIQREGKLTYGITEEGAQRRERTARRPEGIDFSRITFACEDAIDFIRNGTTYDVVLAANLICRLKQPASFLKGVSAMVSEGGILILTSPYSWLETFTPRAEWLGSTQSPLDHIKEILQGSFHFVKALDIPFLIREHLRKYQLGISQASVWKKRDDSSCFKAEHRL